MAFDALFMKMITDELNDQLTGAPVQRVYEPADNEIVIHLYSKGRQPGLLISAHPNYARIHLTEQRPQSKAKPSPFCMLLRKYLLGGRAVSFTSPPMERIMEIAFQPPEGLPPVKLIAEVMGRRSNLILIDTKNLILGAVKTVTWENNPVRAILPGEKYRSVPAQKKLNPFEMEMEEFKRSMEERLENGKKPEKALLESVNGISPLIARELWHRTTGGGVNLTGNDRACLEELYGQAKALVNKSANRQLHPVLLPSKQLYAAFPLKHLEQEKQVPFEKASTLLDQFYGNLIRKDRENQLRERLTGAVQRRLKNLEKKQAQQEKELNEADNAPLHRLYGELLLTYQHQVKRGQSSIILPHLYEPDQKVIVPLDPSRSVSTNAQDHFHRYQKAKKGQDKIKKQLRKTRSELQYCGSLLYTIESSSGESLEEIRQEMLAAGYLREKNKERRTPDSAPQPLSFKTSAGHTVLVGRNNRQNDYITFKAAARRDTWFHVRELPGGHVVLKETSFPPPEEDLEEAAFLAAYYSKGRDRTAVAVDYAEARNVRRRPGGKPGFVFYENFKTITVNPRDTELCKRFQLS